MILPREIAREFAYWYNVAGRDPLWIANPIFKLSNHRVGKIGTDAKMGFLLAL